MPQIDLLQESDCFEIAALHLAHLHTPFAGRPGQELLACYYRAIAQQVGACGYAAREDGQIIGFVCGVWKPESLRLALLRRQWLRLWWWALLQVLRKPGLILDFLTRFRASPNELYEAKNGYELRPIVVSPISRGSGVAMQLLSTLLNDASRRGFDHIFLYTEENNIAAKTFYQKTGFEQVGKVTRQGIIQLRYEHGAKMASYVP